MTTTIPVINLAPALAGDDVAATAALMDEALRTSGFMQIVGHGIPLSVFADAYEQMSLLMQQPAEVHTSLLDPTGHPFYGLVPRRSYKDVPDRVVYHQFELNRYASPDEAQADGVPPEYLSHFLYNLWPADMPDFKRAMQGCFDAMRELAPRLLALFAVALDMPSTFFDEYMTRESTSFGVGDYPFNDWVPAGTEILPWHTDRETLVNMLHQRGTYEGLQLRTLDDEIVTVPMVEDALVVNVGDLFQKWTGGRWLATPHHVVSGGDGQWRQSIVNFSAPDVTRDIAPLLFEGGAVDPLATPFNVYNLALDLPHQKVGV